MTKAEKFFDEIKDKRIAFIGTGVSHNELIRLFLKKGYNIVICDVSSNRQERSFHSVKIILMRFSDVI